MSCIPDGIRQRYDADWTFFMVNHAKETSNCYAARSPEFQMVMLMMMMMVMTTTIIIATVIALIFFVSGHLSLGSCL
jgi:hypothetical protein